MRQVARLSPGLVPANKGAWDPALAHEVAVNTETGPLKRCYYHVCYLLTFLSLFQAITPPSSCTGSPGARAWTRATTGSTATTGSWSTSTGWCAARATTAGTATSSANPDTTTSATTPAAPRGRRSASRAGRRTIRTRHATITVSNVSIIPVHCHLVNRESHPETLEDD